MSNIRVLFAAVLILCLTGFVACKKTEEAPAPAAPAAAAADEAKAAEAKADEAKPAEAKADEAKPAEAKADDGKFTEADINTVVKFFGDLAEIAEKAGDDCDKLGTDLNDHLSKNRDSLVASMKKLATLDEESAEAKKLSESMDKVMGDDSAISKKMDACKDNPQLMGFSMALLGVMMAAVPQDQAAEIMKEGNEEADAAAPAAE